jgi:uncharacterized glyoxalase superfamily protein PhnB
MAAKPVPDGYHTVTPYLTVRGAPKVVEFLEQAFGAKISHEPVKRPDGSIMHVQVTIGDSPVMIAEESEMAKATASSLYLYVPNVAACTSGPSRPAATRSWNRRICSTAIAAAA